MAELPATDTADDLVLAKFGNLPIDSTQSHPKLGHQLLSSYAGIPPHRLNYAIRCQAEHNQFFVREASILSTSFRSLCTSFLSTSF